MTPAAPGVHGESQTALDRTGARIPALMPQLLPFDQLGTFLQLRAVDFDAFLRGVAGILIKHWDFARMGEAVLGEIGLWPHQWATARMFANTAKGFHIHPPHIPGETNAEAWFQRLFVREPANFQLRPYEHEQWDAMFWPCWERGDDPRRRTRRPPAARHALFDRR